MIRSLIVLTIALLLITFTSKVNAQNVSGSFPTWNSDIGLQVTTLPGIINRLVPFLITIAGVILLLMLISGGFQLLTSAASPDQAEAGKKRLTTAIIGFFILVGAFWIFQILEIMFNINIFG